MKRSLSQTPYRGPSWFSSTDLQAYSSTSPLATFQLYLHPQQLLELTVLCLLDFELAFPSFCHSFPLLLGFVCICLLVLVLPETLSFLIFWHRNSHCFSFPSWPCLPAPFLLGLFSLVFGLLFALVGQGPSHPLLQFHHSVLTLTHWPLAQTSLWAQHSQSLLQNKTPIFSRTYKPSVNDSFVLPTGQNRSGFSLCNPNTLYCTTLPFWPWAQWSCTWSLCKVPCTSFKIPFSKTTLMLLLTENPTKASHCSRDEDHTL